MLRRTGISTKHTGHGQTRTQVSKSRISTVKKNKMKFTRIYILCYILVVTAGRPTSDEPPPSSEIAEKKPEEEVHQETLEDLVDLGNEETDLPILPPIILIDFTNGTNLTSEEKSKRTINGNLGYGFQSNNILSGKYNYYFPAGKSGTTVSIEESVSPFLPTTIIEKVNFVPEKLHVHPSGIAYSNGIRSNLFVSSSNGHSQSQNGVNRSPLVFGQRTKLHKSTGDDFQSFTRLSPTEKPDYSGYSTPKPSFQSSEFLGSSLGSYGNPSSTYQDFSTPGPLQNPSIQGQYRPVSGSNFKTYNSPLQSYGGISTTSSPISYKSLSSGASLGSYGKQGSGLQSYSTPKPQIYNPAQSQTTVLSPLGNSPKYSYENGVKYEHKIIWKYPNGMVSDVGPNSYENTYSEYSSPTKISLTSNFQNPEAGNNFPKALSNGYSVNAGSIYSQKPATFPDNGASGNDDSKANQFVSSATISNGDEFFPSQPAPPSQKYSFQDPYSVNSNGQLTKTQTSTSTSSAAYKTADFNKQNYDDSKVISTYPVNSPEAEYPSLGSYGSSETFEQENHPQASPYTYSQNSPISNSYSQSSSLTSDSGSEKIQSTVLSKYTPQVQQYLKKALGLGENGQRQSYEPSTTAQSYSNIKYSNLLDYNPSISQYISNPSSILNAQPTFVQAGNSLVPVIILRVDGAAPIQPKASPNINLKALLQKYLIQYAQTVSDLSEGKSYDQGYGTLRGQSSSGAKQLDLGQLAQSLRQLNLGSNFKQNFAQNFAHSIAQDYQPSTYSSIDSNDAKYLSPVTREAPRKQKVKNVEIIDDPRFTSYKLKN